jgi:hypothetical protein
MAAVFLVQPVRAAAPDGVPLPAQSPPFELTVLPGFNQRPVPEEIKPGEGLGMTFLLKHTGAEPVTLFWGRTAYDNWIRFTIDTPSGRRLVTSFSDPDLRPHTADEKELVTLEPGETVRGRFRVGGGFSGHQSFRFDEPGANVLSASVGLFVAHDDPRQAESWQSLGSITSSPIVFFVNPGEEPFEDRRPVQGQVTDAVGATLVSAVLLSQLWLRREPKPGSAR